MKPNIFSRFLVATAAVLALVAVIPTPLVRYVSAQTFTHNTTTLAAAQTATDTTISLTAVSAASGSSFGAVQAGQFVFVDGELEQFVSVTGTSTIWNVQRRGRLTSHAIGSPVYIGVAGSFQSTPPPPGTCVVASNPKFWINIGGPGAGGPGGNNAPGDIYTCATNGIWTKGNAPWFAGLNSGNGATVTLTAADSGKTFAFDRAAGIIYTLPTPVPGMTFDFVYTVTITSNNATVQTAGGIFLVGVLHTAISGGATGSDWACDGSTHIKIVSNGTTSGGIKGGHVSFRAVTTTLWQIDGLLVGSGTEVTPCST